MDGNIPGRCPVGSDLYVEARNRDRAHRMAQGKFVRPGLQAGGEGQDTQLPFSWFLPQTATVLYEQSQP